LAISRNGAPGRGLHWWAPHLLLAIAMLGRAHSQTEFQFSGYIVNLPIYQTQSTITSQSTSADQKSVIDLTRVRIRPTVYFGEGSSICLEHETTILYDNGTSSALEIAQVLRRQAVSLRWDVVKEPHFVLSHFVDRLYFRQNLASSNLVIGRQRISWGTGRIWNPTDLFNPINPASFEKIEKDGADAVSFKHYFGSFTDLEVVCNPEYRFRRWNSGARFRTNVMEYDLSMMGGYFDGGGVIGGDFAGNVFDAGFRGEGIYSGPSNFADGPFVKFILGLDYQFSATLYGLIEYQYNGQGQTNVNNYQVSRLFSGEILNLSRNYLFTNATYQIHPLVTVAGGINLGLNDGSGFATSNVSWSAASNIDLQVGGFVPFGRETSEFWYYPTSLYFKGTFFF
jgi:hypothetical protein